MTNIPINEQNIIAILGIENLPNERKLAIVEKITTLVQKRLLIKIYDSLPARFQEELGELLDKEDSEKLSEFLEKHVPELPQWIEQETLQMKQELAGWVEALD